MRISQADAAKIIAHVGMDDGVPAIVAAAYFSVSTATVKGWAARRRFQPVGHHPRWGRLYRWRDLVQAEMETRENWNPNRRKIAFAG